MESQERRRGHLEFGQDDNYLNREKFAGKDRRMIVASQIPIIR
jgi:hypothetical protein